MNTYISRENDWMGKRCLTYLMCVTILMSVTSKLDTTRIIPLVKGDGIFAIITRRSFDISYSSLVFVKGNFKDCAIEMVAVLSED